MQEVSQEWKDNQKQLLTSPAHIRIEYFAINPDITALSSELGKVNWADNYNEAGLNGYFYEDATQTPPKELPKYTINFSKKVHPANNILALKFVEKGTITKSSFDGNFYPATFDEYAEQFDVKVYNGTTLLETQHIFNSSLYRYVEITSTNYDKIEIVFIQWSVDLGYAYIESAYIESKIVLNDSNIISMNCSESIELNSFSIPKNELRFTLNNADDNYNPDNPQSILNNLNEKQELKVYFGYDLIDSNDEPYTEWIDGGTYFITEWDIPQNGITATFTARDGTIFMNIPYDNQVSGSLVGGKYQLVEYIYSNGSGYIDTHYTPTFNKTYKILVEFSLQYNNGTPQTIFGSFDGTNYLEFCVSSNNYLQLKFLNKVENLLIPETNKQYQFYCSFYVSQESSEGWIGYNLYESDTQNSLTSGVIWDGAGTPPNYPIYISALNNQNTALSISTVKINRFGIACEEDNYYMDALACYDTTNNYIGLYSISGNIFLYGNGYSKADYIYWVTTLWDVANHAFMQSGIPNGISEADVYSQYLTEKLKKYPVSLPQDFNHSCAETVQLCCNAARCVWYFDRQGLSHIEPFDIGKKELPSTYQEVSYLSFSIPNTNVIDLGIYPTDTTVIRIKYQGDSNGSNTIGMYNADETNAFRFFNYGGAFYLDYGSGAGLNRISGGTYDTNKVYNLEIGNRYIKDLDTNQLIISDTKVTFDRKTNKLFFANVFDGILISLEIYIDNILVGDFVPCYLKSDTNIKGLYNLVNDTFCGETGTGIIGVGSDVVNPTPTTFNQYVIDRELNAYAEGEYSLLPELKEVNVNDGQAVYPVAKVGETQTIKNELIQSPLQAMQVAEWVSRTLTERKSVSGEYRPDPRADVLDKGQVKNKYANLDVFFTELNYSFNGAFKGNYTAKVKD